VRRGKRLDAEGRSGIDFDLELGRVLHAQGAPDRALAAYRRSLRRGETATSRAHQAAALWDLDRPREAYAAVRRAIELQPDDPVATELAARLQAAWLARLEG
jgi:tetratricopeptide (TPR) repeat protein